MLDLTDTIPAYQPSPPKIYITSTIRSKPCYYDLSPSPLQHRSIHAFLVPSLLDVCGAWAVEGLHAEVLWHGKLCHLVCVIFWLL